MSASRHKTTMLLGNQYFRWHAEPLSVSGDRKLRKRFPIRSRSEWYAVDYVPIREPFLTDSSTGWASFTRRQRTIQPSESPQRVGLIGQSSWNQKLLRP